MNSDCKELGELSFFSSFWFVPFLFFTGKVTKAATRPKVSSDIKLKVHRKERGGVFTSCPLPLIFSRAAMGLDSSKAESYNASTCCVHDAAGSLTPADMIVSLKTFISRRSVE
ncbi:unnamed protein product [Malus baccata var. baccata]